MQLVATRVAELAQRVHFLVREHFLDVLSR